MQAYGAFKGGIGFVDLVSDVLFVFELSAQRQLTGIFFLFLGTLTTSVLTNARSAPSWCSPGGC